MIQKDSNKSESMIMNIMVNEWVPAAGSQHPRGGFRAERSTLLDLKSSKTAGRLTFELRNGVPKRS